VGGGKFDGLEKRKKIEKKKKITLTRIKKRREKPTSCIVVKTKKRLRFSPIKKPCRRGFED